MIDCNSQRGGIYQYALSLIEDWVKYSSDKYHAKVIASDPDIIKAIDPNIEVFLYETKRQNQIRLKRVMYILGNYGFMPKFLGAPDYIKNISKYDLGVMICFNQRPDGYYAGYPSITAVHDSPRQWNNSAKKLQSLGYKIQFESECYRISRQPGCVLCDSEQSSEQYSRAYRTITPALYLPFRPLSMFSRRINIDILNKYKIKLPFIYYPSTTHPVKNHIRLIDALKNLNSRIALHKINLVLTGPKDRSTDEIIDYAVKAGICMSHIGYVSENEVCMLYSIASALVMPSMFDFMNIPALEALSCGCPIVLSDYNSLKKHFGNIAVYVDPLNINSISNGISKAVFDKAYLSMIKIEGPKFIEKFHSGEKRIDILTDAISILIDNV